MTKEDFKNRMLKLVPTFSMQAMDSWMEYAAILENDGTIAEEEFFAKTYVEFMLTVKHHGAKTAKVLFDAGEIFTLNPFEIRGAATLLEEGLSMDEVEDYVLLKGCNCTPEEAEESKAALEQLMAEEKNNSGMDLPGMDMGGTQ